MTAKRKAPVAPHDRGPTTRQDPARNLTAAADSRHTAGRVQLRTDPSCCPACAAPLDVARVPRRSVRVLRSGPHIGRRAEFWHFRCECGATRRVLWLITLPAAGGRAA